ncbi:hypothetical protein [Hymenobacter lapidarius]|nr:hypothetical protein [Hymenobacter lapidarius]
MALSLIVFAGFYPPARRAIQYADILAQALAGRLVLLHVNRASLFDPYDSVAQGYHQQELRARPTRPPFSTSTRKACKPPLRWK